MIAVNERHSHDHICIVSTRNCVYSRSNKYVLRLFVVEHPVATDFVLRKPAHVLENCEQLA